MSARKHPRHLDTFLSSYVETALWSSMDESDESGGEPMDKNYGPGDIAPATMRAMERDCANFIERFGHLITDDDSPAIRKHGAWDLAGHVFWLSRNGHGVSFSDGDWPTHGEELDKAAESYGDFELYVGDDGLIYAVGHESDGGGDGQNGAQEARSGLPQAELEKLRSTLGTVAHNRAFSVRDLADYARMDPKRAARVVQALLGRGLVERVERGRFSPTIAGWGWIERGEGGAQEGPMAPNETRRMPRRLGTGLREGGGYTVEARPKGSGHVQWQRGMLRPGEWLPAIAHDVVASTFETRDEAEEALAGLLGQPNASRVDFRVVEAGSAPGAREPRRHRVADFNSLTDLIEHARREGATHVLVAGWNSKVYYRHGHRHEEARVWRERGYWHAEAPSDRTVVERLPPGAEPIGTYLRRSGLAAEGAPPTGERRLEAPRRAPVTMRAALGAWRAGNDAGMGYAPYTDEVRDDTIEEAVAAAERDGWQVVLPRRTSDEVVVLRDADGGWMGIGGDAMGRGAWAVDLDAMGTRWRGGAHEPPASGGLGEARRRRTTDPAPRVVESRAHEKEFVAVEFDLARGQRTGKLMTFGATSLKDAADKLAYTLNLSSSGWQATASGRTVGRKTGDVGWHLVEAGSPAARNMGVSLDARGPGWREGVGEARRRRRAAPRRAPRAEYPYERSPSDRYVLTRDGAEVARGTEQQVWAWMHGHLGYSISHALRHEGYKITPVEKLQAVHESHRTSARQLPPPPDPAGQWAVVQRMMKVYAKQAGLGDYVHNTALPTGRPGVWRFWAQRPGERSHEYEVTTQALHATYRRGGLSEGVDEARRRSGYGGESIVRGPYEASRLPNGKWRLVYRRRGGGGVQVLGDYSSDGAAMDAAADHERRRHHQHVQDYEATDLHGRRVAGPSKSYDAMKREADRAGGVVKFVFEGGRTREHPYPHHHRRRLHAEATRRRSPPLRVGTIVRYVGNVGALAGMEGYVFELTGPQDAWGEGAWIVWAPFRPSDRTHVRAGDVRVLRAFSASFARRYVIVPFDRLVQGAAPWLGEGPDTLGPRRPGTPSPTATAAGPVCTPARRPGWRPRGATAARRFRHTPGSSSSATERVTRRSSATWPYRARSRKKRSPPCARRGGRRRRLPTVTIDRSSGFTSAGPGRVTRARLGWRPRGTALGAPTPRRPASATPRSSSTATTSATGCGDSSSRGRRCGRRTRTASSRSRRTPTSRRSPATCSSSSAGTSTASSTCATSWEAKPRTATRESSSGGSTRSSASRAGSTGWRP